MTGDMITKYFDLIKSPTVHPITRLYFLNDDDTTAFEIGEDFVTGDLSVSKNDGTRRTATVTITNADSQYKISLDDIWIGRKVRIEAGVRGVDGEEYLFPQGIFYIKDPEEQFSPNDKTLKLTLVDKFAWHDGTLCGALGGVYQINPGDDLRIAAQQLLLQDCGNGIPADSTPPVFDSYYNDKTAMLADGTTVPFVAAPYTYRTDASGTRADVLLAINTMLVASCGYDTYGHFKYMSAQTDILDVNRPIAWEFSVHEKELFSASYLHKMSSVCNDVRVIGAVLNGTQVQGRATNHNPRSDTSVEKIGYHTYVTTNEKYTTFKQCNELAKYELRNRTMVQKSVTFSTTPIYHLNEDDLVTLLRPDVSEIPSKYLVLGFTLPLGKNDAMSITAVSVDDIDIYDKWLTSHDLTVLCSEVGSLTLTADGVAHNISNPYVAHEIPAGITVTLTTTDTPRYTISSAVLNGVPIAHTGSECTFVMPEYDTRIVLTLSLVNGKDVAFTYTGSYEEIKDAGLDYKVMSGIKYRLWKFTSDGTLSFDESLLTKGIVGDIHCRGGGGGGSDGAAGSNGYDMCENGISLVSCDIVVGTGGVFEKDKGKRGSITSYSNMVEAPGGSGATGSATGYGGSLTNPFQSDYVDTTSGAGGTIGNGGNDGVCYMRIAI